MNLTTEFRKMIEEQEHEGIDRFDLSQEKRSMALAAYLSWLGCIGAKRFMRSRPRT
jgi:hypothetical protein